MKLFQNKIVVGGVCILVAALLAFLLLPSLNKGKNNTIKAVFFTQEVAAGTKITKEMTEEKEIGSYGLSDKVITSIDQIEGKYITKNVTPEEILLTSMFSDYAADERLDKIYQNGQKLATVTVTSLAAGVGNNVKSGDIVSILCYEDKWVHSYNELKGLEVYSVENDDAQSLEEAQNDEEAEKLASTITLIVTDEQAERLIYAEYSGKLHVVLEKRGVFR